MSKALQTLNADETTALLNHLISSNRENKSIRTRTRNYALASFMLEAGLRVGELVQLRLSDICVDGRPVNALVVRASIAKNKVEREIPCTNRLKQIIDMLMTQVLITVSAQPDSYIFTTHWNSSPLTTRQVRNIIYAASAQTIGRCIHPHVLRHTFATRLMRVTNIRVVQKLLGHKNIGSTQIYTHPNNQDLSEAISKI